MNTGQSESINEKENINEKPPESRKNWETDPSIKVAFDEYESKKQFDNASKAFFVILWLSVAFVICGLGFSLIFPLITKINFKVNLSVVSFSIDASNITELPILSKTATEFMSLAQDFLYVLVVVFGLIFIIKGKSASDIGGLIEKVTAMVIAIKTPKLPSPSTPVKNSAGKKGV